MLLSFNAEISSALLDLSEEELMMEIVLELLAWLTSSRLKNPVEVVLWNGVVESDVTLPRLTLLPLL